LLGIRSTRCVGASLPLSSPANLTLLCRSHCSSPGADALFQPPQEFSRTVSSEEGRAFAASRDPPWLFAECSAKKGGDDVSGAEGIFGKVVDKVRRPFLSLPLPACASERLILSAGPYAQIIETPSLYTKTSLPTASSTTTSTAKKGATAGGGPPGQYPARGTINLDEEMEGSGGWCAC
jgi:Ras-related protein Rab-18